VYLLLKLPISIAAFFASLILLPLMAVELLILAPLTVDLHLLTARVLRWLALLSYRSVMWLLPSEQRGRVKAKRSRLELVDDYDDDFADEERDARYYIDSEGEIQMASRRG